jgi:hypothetical protein
MAVGRNCLIDVDKPELSANGVELNVSSRPFPSVFLFWTGL